MSKDIRKQPIGDMPLETWLRSLKGIINSELQPLRQRITALEVENRALRARINAKESQGGTRYQPLRRA